MEDTRSDADIVPLKGFNFWYRWLLVVSILNIPLGLIIAFFPHVLFFDIYNAAITNTFLNGELTEEIDTLRTFFFGIIGGTLVGYFLLQTLIVWIPFYRRELWSWHAVCWALVVWFAVDSTLSL